jgi:hypothetical protein
MKQSPNARFKHFLGNDGVSLWNAGITKVSISHHFPLKNRPSSREKQSLPLCFSVF